MNHVHEAKGIAPLPSIETRVGRADVLRVLRMEGAATARQLHAKHFAGAGSIEDVGRQLSDLVLMGLACVIREKSRFPHRHHARLYRATPNKVLA